MTFRCRGVRVTLSFWFFCGAVLLLSADRSGTAGLFFWAIALHEGGHLLYLRLARLPVGELRLSPLGLLLSLSAGCHPGPGQSLLLNLSGCAANLTAAVNRLTALYRAASFEDKAVFAIVVSGYSGGDLVASQVVSALCVNKGFRLPPGAILMETANDAGAALRLPGMEGRLDRFAENLLEQLKL